MTTALLWFRRDLRLASAPREAEASGAQARPRSTSAQVAFAS
jgi:hypothetical protein